MDRIERSEVGMEQCGGGWGNGDGDTCTKHVVRGFVAQNKTFGIDC